MHECLQIPEVVRSICDESSKRDALHFGLTSRSFLQPSLDSIWRELDSFKPMIGCMPSDMWIVKTKIQGSFSPIDVYCLRRTITPKDLERYLGYYAPRIRTFSARYKPYTLAHHTFFSPQTFQGLQLATQFRPGVLAPLLTSLEWMNPGEFQLVAGLSHVERAYPFVSLLLAESVVSLQLEFYTYIHLHISSVSYALGRLPRLRALRLHTDDGEVALDTCVGPQAWGLDRMESLDISSTFTTSIQHLASLPQLSNLEISNLFSSTPTAPLRTKRTTGFSSLHTLTVLSATVEDFIELVSHLEPQRNRIQSINASLAAPSSPAQAQGVVDAVLEGVNRDTLASLYITLGPAPSQFVLGEEQTDAATQDLYQPNGGIDLSTLFMLKNLVRLSLATKDTIRITPEDALRIPAQWPMLTHLALGGGHPCRTVPQIDHTHLLAILEGCPALDALSLQFDASRITGKERSRTGPFALRVCNVGDSPIYSTSRVTEFFTENFPNLRGFYIYNHYVRRGISQPSTFEQRWEVVQGAITDSVVINAIQDSDS